MSDADRLKVFHLSNALVNAELDGVEHQFAVTLGHRGAVAAEEKHGALYLQFPTQLRTEAGEMGGHYELFYCLENSIRDLVATALEAAAGPEWWDLKVPQAVKDNVDKNLTREREAGVSQRSPDRIDYTTFGELSEVIQANWDVFADTFNNRKALVRVLSGLNLLRGPIAHCSPLAADEVVRLDLALRDWFRLME
jgi:hypothetical protein